MKPSIVPILILLLGAGLWAQDYKVVRKDVQIFGTILDTAIRNSFSNPLIQGDSSRGVYLKGYGATFYFPFYVNRTVQTPFGVVGNRTDDEPRKKEERVRQLKELLITTLGDYANAINQIAPFESVAVVVFLQDRMVIDEALRNRTLLVRTSKQALLEYATRKIDQAEFRRRVEIVEY